MTKYFIITVDTEGDNLWEPVIRPGGMRAISVKNAAYIERFQNLCETHHFIPTYLVNYEMAWAEPFVEMAKDRVQNRKCEIGMHMHAWNTPPIYELEYKRGINNPYAGEYPREIVWKKLKNLTMLLKRQFGITPVSHRGGRWYIDAWYVNALGKLGYKVDCSVTPGVSWKSNIGYEHYGRDYIRYPRKAYRMDSRHLPQESEKGIWEVPPTIMNAPLHTRIGEMLRAPYAYKTAVTRKIWLRPNGDNLEDMLYIVSQYAKSKCDYLEFMIHSSELMPGGSPTFTSSSSIEKMYQHMEIVFDRIESTYKGIALYDYVKLKKGDG